MERIEKDSFLDMNEEYSLELQEMYLEDLAQEEMWADYYDSIRDDY